MHHWHPKNLKSVCLLTQRWLLRSSCQELIQILNNRDIYVGSGQASYQRFSWHLNRLKRSTPPRKGSEESTSGGGAIIPLRRCTKTVVALLQRKIYMTWILNFKGMYHAYFLAFWTCFQSSLRQCSILDVNNITWVFLVYSLLSHLDWFIDWIKSTLDWTILAFIFLLTAC